MLGSILESGVPAGAEGRIVLDRSSPHRPEPYNAKFARRGDEWGWAERVIVGSGNLVFFALRGPEIFVVKW